MVTLEKFTMRLHRFFIGQIPVTSPLVINDQDLLHQWQKVLRLKTGSLVILAHETLGDITARIDSSTKEQALLTICSMEKNNAEPQQNVHLYASILKRDNFEWLAQKCVECGVKSITPLKTDRTIKTKLNVERLQKIMKEAAEQSGRSMVPALRETVTLTEGLQSAAQNQHDILFADTEKSGHSAKSVSRDIALFIGPEGGWSEEEITLSKSMNARFISLGSTILRAETAAIVGVHRLAYQ